MATTNVHLKAWSRGQLNYLKLRLNPIVQGLESLNVFNSHFAKIIHDKVT